MAGRGGGNFQQAIQDLPAKRQIHMFHLCQCHNGSLLIFLIWVTM